MYLLPEAEIYSHNVSQKLGQNIKLVREFHDLNLGFYQHFMICSSNLVVDISWQNDKTRRMKSCIIASNGAIHYSEGEEVPFRYIWISIHFDSIPLAGFYQQTKLLERNMWEVEFLFRKIPGCAFEAIEIENEIIKIDMENTYVFSGLNFVVMNVNNLLDPLEVPWSKNQTICNVQKGNKNFQSLLILCELQLKESNKYKLVEKCRNNLETFIDELFVVDNIVFNKIQGIMLIQVRTCDKIILFLYNIKLMNIQETVTIFESQVHIKHYSCPTEVFFVNHTDYDDGLIVAASCLHKQIKVFSRTLKTGYRLLLRVSLNFDDFAGSREYSLYCASNRCNQILFFVPGINGIIVYDLFDMSNQTVFGLSNRICRHPPELYFNESGEEFYVIYDDKICVYLYKSMFKSLVSLSASVVAQTYKKPQLIEMRLPQHIYKYLNHFW